MGKKDSLTVKQEAFAQTYVKLGNASEAYRQVYNVAPNRSAVSIGVEASTLLALPKVSLKVQELRQEVQDTFKMDLQYWLATLRENIERCLQHQPTLDRAGKPTGEYVYRPNAVNRSLELLGKHLGLLIERTDHRSLSVNLDVVATLREEYSLEDLKLMLQAIRAKGGSAGEGNGAQKQDG